MMKVLYSQFYQYQGMLYQIEADGEIVVSKNYLVN